MPTPELLPIVAKGIAVRQLEADELAFMQEHVTLGDKTCLSYLFASYTVAETRKPGYTAGAVMNEPGDLEVHAQGLNANASADISIISK